MGLLSFFKGLLKKENAKVSNTEEQIKVAPVVTPDPVVVDTETVTENLTVEKKKRAPKAPKELKIEKKTVQKK